MKKLLTAKWFCQFSKKREKKASRTCLLICCLCAAAATSPAFADIVYGVSTGLPDARGVWEIDLETANITLLFSTAAFPSWWGATDGDNTTTFFSTTFNTSLADASLYRINVIDETVTLIGSYGGLNIRELAYNELNGVLYATDYSNLYSLDIATAAPTLIGSFNGPSQVWGMDYDESIGELIGVDDDTDSMYYINMATGNAAFAASLSGTSSAVNLTDVWYDDVSGGMFAITGNVLYELDSSTGVLTRIDTTGSNILGLGRPVPEPATGLLVVLGSFFAFAGRRQNSNRKDIR
jgi:hypothetical protein